MICSNPPFPEGDGGRFAIRQDIIGVIQNNPHIKWDIIVLWSEDMVSTAKWLNKQEEVNNYWVFDRPVVNPFNFLKSNPEHIERFVSANVIKEVLRIVTKTQYKVIFLNGIYSGAFAFLISKPYKSKMIYRSHNIEYLLWQQVLNSKLFSFSQIPLSLYALNESVKYKSFERSVWQQADEIWSIGYHDTFVIRKHNKNTKWILPNFRFNNTEVNYFESPNLTAFLLTSYQWFPNKFGLIFWLKNIFPYISKSLPNWQFIIGGRGTEALHKFTQKNLNITGWIHDPAKYFLNSFVFFVPVWISSGVRIKIIEATLHGKVIVSTFEGVKGLPLVKWKHYIPVDSTPQSWVNAFKWIEKNREEAQQMAIQCRQYVQKVLKHKSNLVIEL